MKPLLRNLKTILPKIKKSKKTLLFLDYDGTITPIVNKPDEALLSPGTKQILKRLIENKRMSVSVVSGRTLRQIKRLVGLRDIYYAGCHGLELKFGGREYILPEAKKSIPVIKRLKRILTVKLKDIRLAEIEDKGIILTVHYRRVKKSLIPQLKQIFRRITGPYIKSRKINIAAGKKVLEIKPPVGWNKGKYCLYLLGKLGKKGRGPLAIYIGDDETDESAFKRLRKRGITIFVKGEKRNSSAEYYLNSTRDVANFLKRLTL